MRKEAIKHGSGWGWRLRDHLGKALGKSPVGNLGRRVGLEGWAGLEPEAGPEGPFGCSCHQERGLVVPSPLTVLDGLGQLGNRLGEMVFGGGTVGASELSCRHRLVQAEASWACVYLGEVSKQQQMVVGRFYQCTLRVWFERTAWHGWAMCRKACVI